MRPASRAASRPRSRSVLTPSARSASPCACEAPPAAFWPRDRRSRGRRSMAASSGAGALARAWGWPMTSEARLLPLLAALTGACGGSVHDASVGSAPLLVIHGHVDRASLQRTKPEAPLLGALGWAALPAVSPLCLEFSAP